MSVLLEYTCSNFKSIKDKVSFSAIASKDDVFNDKLIEFGNYRILRSAVFYGANGSGKSNFLSSLLFMRNLVSNSINHQPGMGIFQAPHKLADENMPSQFSMQFEKNGVRYAYGFSIIKNAVSDEYLYFFPNGRKTQIFEREGLNITAGSKYRKLFELSMSVLKENRLFLSCAANYTNIKEIENAFLFFAEDIVVYNGINNWIEYSIELIQKNSVIKNLFVNLLQGFNTGIKDIDTKLEHIIVNPNDFPNEFPAELKPLLAGEAQKFEATIVYDKFSTNLMTEESDGIKRLFEMLCPIIDIIIKGKILVCDELERSLHETLVYKIVELFQNASADKTAQLFFTTHDTSLLNADLFRRDQIWFTELRDEDRSTDLYSLVEVKNVRKTENLEKGYISGKYGAIPILNPNLVESFTKKI